MLIIRGLKSTRQPPQVRRYAKTGGSMPLPDKLHTSTRHRQRENNRCLLS